jgi:hypothetical protein
MQAPGRRAWTLLAGMGLLFPALIAALRVLVLRCTILRELPHGLIPLAGPVDGIWPHPFYCVMHDLTHPVLLFAYAVALAWLPLHARATPLTGHRGLALFGGIILLHAALVISYCVSVLLPVGDMVTTLRP